MSGSEHRFLHVRVGSLSADQEKEFIFRRLERIGGEAMSSSVRRAMTEVVSTSQEAIREFAAKNIYVGLLRVTEGLSEGSAPEVLKAEASERAKSVVSLRDIQRVSCAGGIRLSC